MQVVERAWEWHFAASPDDLWPLLADTARFNEAMGLPRYAVTDIPQPDGSVRRVGAGRRMGLNLTWEEGVPQWVAGRRFFHERLLHSRLIRRVATTIELDPAEEGGTAVRYTLTIEANLPTAMLMRLFGLKSFGQSLDKLFREAAQFAEASERDRAFAAPPTAVPEPVRQRVNGVAQAMAARGLYAADHLAAELLDAPESDLERMRPRTLARRWQVTPRAAIETCLAAVREGLLTLRWDLVCPQCRGAKVTATSLDQLPQGAHCSSCNIDYGRDFTRNVEVTFEPAAAVRELGIGTYCLASPLASEHVKIQHRLLPGESAVLPAHLADGQYRVRTVEPGAAADFLIEDGNIPQLTLTDAAPELGPPEDRVFVRNAGSSQRTLVVEDRRWAQDALTAHEATTMQAFRDLFADQVLRPGDQVAIGRIALLFTDIKGSTALYNRVGDARAYGLVREHFAELTRAVREHDGAVVKTIGDAVMAAFTNPADALDAALAMRDAIALFNQRLAAETGNERVGIVVKVGLHTGACIAVTLNDRLDYFGSTVNLAARLEGESLGGDIVLSEAMAAGPALADRLARLGAVCETAPLKGFAEPVALRRIPAVE
ncbi:MAG TPA: adenylate/guanylate cyclase domain-containing protein [Stellaceae bacterium]|nr:adenylate/guanylate cyclase domain-containing protein [Stellaceae bacterium]